MIKDFQILVVNSFFKIEKLVIFRCVLRDCVLRVFLVVSQNPCLFGSGVVVDVPCIAYGFPVAHRLVARS